MELDNQDEEEVPDLGFAFSDVSDVQSDVGAKLERGDRLVIRDGAFRRSSKNQSDGKKLKKQGEEDTLVQAGKVATKIKRA